MNTPLHDCPNCRCRDTRPIETWATTHLIPTHNHQDKVSTLDLWQHLARWCMANGHTDKLITRNQLTRWVSAQGYPIRMTGGRGNHLIGYRLAT